MSQWKYTKPEKVNLKNDPSYNEKWVQNIIAEDPSILGLGDLILKDKETRSLRCWKVGFTMSRF
ncbi:hypothetical protein R4538_16235 [Vibrio cholerae]|nr:hypothetical protein R4538_16235 [Vibrio cholerae]